MHHEIEAHLGRPVDWEAEFETRCDDVFARELLPVPGILEALARIATATCVASSGSHEKKRMGVPAGRCAVVEDSVSGVTAGLAADMAVFAFGGGVTNAARLAIGSATVFDDMGQLPDLLDGQLNR